MAPEMQVIQNNPNVSLWSLETGYEGDSSEWPFYPIRVSDASEGTALDIMLSFDQSNANFDCNGWEQGYRMVNFFIFKY